MDATTSDVFYEMLVEEQADRELGEESGVLLKQSVPKAGDEVPIGSQRRWRVHSVESYGLFALAWIVRADLPTPEKQNWITEIRAEFHSKGGLSIVLTPDRSILEWGGTEPNDLAEARIGERMNDYHGTGQRYQVAGMESEIMKVTPNQWVIDRCESFSPSDSDSSYTRIDLYWCKASEIAIAA